MKLRIPVSLTAWVIGGMAIGLLVGEGTFAQLDAALGDRLADLGLGIVGALLGALAHEVVATLRRPL